MNIQHKFSAMTFSEFGRRIKSNGGYGTDHVTAGPVMVFGYDVNPGFIGDNPVIPQTVTDHDNLEMQNDYRSVYASILSDWFQVAPDVMSDVLFQNFPILPIFKSPFQFQSLDLNSSQETLYQNFPNPFTVSTTIRFGTYGGMVTIILLDKSGRLLNTIIKQQYAGGTYEISFLRQSLPAGTYFYQLIDGNNKLTRQMTIVD